MTDAPSKGIRIAPDTLAALIIAGGVVGFTGSGVALNHQLNEHWQFLLTVFQHGCEGALVGGICDIFAVSQVYARAHDNYDQLREEVSNTVVTDMINVREVVSEAADLEAYLRDPENHQMLAELLQSTLPERSELDEDLEELWHREIRSLVLDWALSVDPHLTVTASHERTDIDLDVFRFMAANVLRYVAEQDSQTELLVQRLKEVWSDVGLQDLGIPSDSTEVRSILEAIWAQWLEIASKNERPGFGERIAIRIAPNVMDRLAPAIADAVSTTSVREAIEPLLNTEQAQLLLDGIADQLEVTELILEGQHGALFDDVLAYLGVFWQAWREQPTERRLELINEVLRLAERPMLTWIGDAIWSFRMELLTPEVVLEKRVARILVESLSEQIRSNADKAEEQALTELNRRFERMGADGFVEMLRFRTQRQLDWIKVNGSALGFVIGTVVGLVGWGLKGV